MAVRLTKWIVFGVVLGLIPLLTNVAKIKILRDPSTFGYPNEQSLTLLQLASYKGELLLLAAGLSAAGVGDLIGSRLSGTPGVVAKYVICGFCLANLMAVCLLYPFVSDFYQRFGLDQIATVTWLSVGSFTAAVATSGVCVMLAGVQPAAGGQPAAGDEPG